MKIKKEVMLVPVHTYTTLKGERVYERVLLYEEDFPLCLIPVDLFYEKGGDEKLYDVLYKQGNTVKCQIAFEELNAKS